MCRRDVVTVKSADSSPAVSQSDNRSNASAKVVKSWSEVTSKSRQTKHLPTFSNAELDLPNLPCLLKYASFSRHFSYEFIITLMDTLLGYCRVHDNVRTLSYNEYCVILSLLDWGSQENPRPCLAIRSSSGRFVCLYCSLGWDDLYPSCGGLRASGRS